MFSWKMKCKMESLKWKAVYTVKKPNVRLSVVTPDGVKYIQVTDEVIKSIWG